MVKATGTFRFCPCNFFLKAAYGGNMYTDGEQTAIVVDANPLPTLLIS